jgi:hypothetical protein
MRILFEVNSMHTLPVPPGVGSSFIEPSALVVVMFPEMASTGDVRWRLAELILSLLDYGMGGLGTYSSKRRTCEFPLPVSFICW